MNCETQEFIADQIGVDKATMSPWLQERRTAEVQPPESRQHFDIWTFQAAAGESSYFGRMPPQVVENLLWLYTEPGGIVVDPFAGGGTTIDVAKGDEAAACGRRIGSRALRLCRSTNTT